MGRGTKGEGLLCSTFDSRVTNADLDPSLIRPANHGSSSRVLIFVSRSVDKYETPPLDLSNVVAIAASSGHTLALKQDGTVVGWGWNEVGEATGIPTTNVTHLDYISSGQVSIG